MMYKNLLVISVCLGVFFVSSIGFLKADSSDIYLTLCDNSQKEFIIDAGQEKEFCFNLTNTSDKDYILTYGFTESTINNIGRQLCNGTPSSGNSFAKMFKNPDLKDITIKGGETKQVKEIIRIPVGITGTQYGCISYTVKDGEYKTKGSLFTVIIARTLPLKIFVGKVSDIISQIELMSNKGGVFTTNNKIKAKVDEENNLILSFLVRNKGNVEQNIIITGKVYNILGFEKDFSVPVKKIGAGEDSEFVANVGILPFYKGFFTVKFNVENTPIFGFDTKNLDKKHTQVGNISDKGNIYIFSWLTLILIIVIILFVYKFLVMEFVRKKS